MDFSPMKASKKETHGKQLMHSNTVYRQVSNTCNDTHLKIPIGGIQGSSQHHGSFNKQQQQHSHGAPLKKNSLSKEQRESRRSLSESSRTTRQRPSHSANETKKLLRDQLVKLLNAEEQDIEEIQKIYKRFKGGIGKVNLSFNHL